MYFGNLAGIKRALLENNSHKLTQHFEICRGINDPLVLWS